jgi:hypothetical protein
MRRIYETARCVLIYPGRIEPSASEDLGRLFTCLKNVLKECKAQGARDIAYSLSAISEKFEDQPFFQAINDK